ncbi:lipopolysaccharide transport periplasmic protein LptA [Halioxenophilus sp. WMMB6]|uniref:lipopolysaccharide transport periplasmic protein LptA n=1 Tax=Halioxenophilus sp. WMMB6 TaxID=3073815 RepID=UPI00295F1274|nr:lipopolysaccharide transport periplasmic protein LptA [Halioxenophilus sp. WMMB6]
MNPADSAPHAPIWRLLARSLLLFATALSLSFQINALPDDRQQPVKINSDRAVRNENTGVTQFIGNATLIQGSLVIRADNITVSHSNEGIKEITAVGKPAIFEQQPKANQGVVTAKALRIEYEVGSEIVHLINNASIDQDGSLITSDTIRYDMQNALAEAGGSERVNIVIPPNQTTTEQ